MIDILTTFAAGLLLLQSLIITLAVVGAWRRPERTLAMFAGNSIRPPAPALVADPASALFMVPLQALVAALMFHTGYAIFAHPGALPEDVPLLFGAFALMELGFVLIRLRINGLRGAKPFWHFTSRDKLVSARACAVSMLFAIVYGAAALVAE
jgi:hypothetical protein